MYGKIEDNKLIAAPSRIVLGNVQIFNPSDAQYEQAGYKELIYSNPPEYKPGFQLVQSWIEEDNSIVQSWEYAPVSSIDAEEALEIILGA